MRKPNARRIFHKARIGDHTGSLSGTLCASRHLPRIPPLMGATELTGRTIFHCPKGWNRPDLRKTSRRSRPGGAQEFSKTLAKGLARPFPRARRKVACPPCGHMAGLCGPVCRGAGHGEPAETGKRSGRYGPLRARASPGSDPSASANRSSPAGLRCCASK